MVGANSGFHNAFLRLLDLIKLIKLLPHNTQTVIFELVFLAKKLHY